MLCGLVSEHTLPGSGRVGFGTKFSPVIFSEEEGRHKIKKLSPLLGYLVMIAAIVFALSNFF